MVSLIRTELAPHRLGSVFWQGCPEPKNDSAYVSPHFSNSFQRIRFQRVGDLLLGWASEQHAERFDYQAGADDRKLAGRKGEKLADFRWGTPPESYLVGPKSRPTGGCCLVAKLIRSESHRPKSDEQQFLGCGPAKTVTFVDEQHASRLQANDNVSKIDNGV